MWNVIKMDAFFTILFCFDFEFLFVISFSFLFPWVETARLVTYRRYAAGPPAAADLPAERPDGGADNDIY
ncbi:MAG: hypothetical protein LUG18_15260 [Candidatus Azobacteroides sp.]|nr:hypothetical protein [Candidatus Azobacteroides sp.]